MIHRKAWISTHRRCKDCKSYPCHQGAKVYNSTHHLDQPEGQGDAVATGDWGGDRAHDVRGVEGEVT